MTLLKVSIEKRVDFCKCFFILEKVQTKKKKGRSLSFFSFLFILAFLISSKNLKTNILQAKLILIKSFMISETVSSRQVY